MYSTIYPKFAISFVKCKNTMPHYGIFKQEFKNFTAIEIATVAIVVVYLSYRYSFSRSGYLGQGVIDDPLSMTLCRFRANRRHSM